MRYALIYAGVVRNVVEAPEDWPGLQDADAAIQSDEAGPGWTWDGESFSPPAPPDLAVRRLAVDEAIKVERDHRTQTGGYAAGGH